MNTNTTNRSPYRGSHNIGRSAQRGGSTSFRRADPQQQAASTETGQIGERLYCLIFSMDENRNENSESTLRLHDSMNFPASGGPNGSVKRLDEIARKVATKMFLRSNPSGRQRGRQTQPTQRQNQSQEHFRQVGQGVNSNGTTVQPDGPRFLPQNPSPLVLGSSFMRYGTSRDPHQQSPLSRNSVSTTHRSPSRSSPALPQMNRVSQFPMPAAATYRNRTASTMHQIENINRRTQQIRSVQPNIASSDQQPFFTSNVIVPNPTHLNFEEHQSDAFYSAAWRLKRNGFLTNTASQNPPQKKTLRKKQTSLFRKGTPELKTLNEYNEKDEDSIKDGNGNSQS